MIVEIVTRPNVTTNIETTGFFTHVVISHHFGEEDSEHIEVHYFCTEAEIEKYKKQAEWYEDSKVYTMSLQQYIEQGYAYIRVQLSN